MPGISDRSAACAQVGDIELERDRITIAVGCRVYFEIRFATGIHDVHIAFVIDKDILAGTVPAAIAGLDVQANEIVARTRKCMLKDLGLDRTSSKVPYIIDERFITGTAGGIEHGGERRRLFHGEAGFTIGGKWTTTEIDHQGRTLQCIYCVLAAVHIAGAILAAGRCHENTAGVIHHIGGRVIAVLVEGKGIVYPFLNIEHMHFSAGDRWGTREDVALYGDLVRLCHRGPGKERSKGESEGSYHSFHGSGSFWSCA